jgi:hypothetical protein
MVIQRNEKLSIRNYDKTMPAYKGGKKINKAITI